MHLVDLGQELVKRDVAYGFVAPQLRGLLMGLAGLNVGPNQGVRIVDDIGIGIGLTNSFE